MPSSSRRSTVSSCTASARSMAGSGSARKKRFLLFSAGATTSTSASSASSGPTAERSASAEMGSETSARIFFGMVAVYRDRAQDERWSQGPPHERRREHELHARKRQL